MAGIPMPRYDLMKRNRYVNKTFVQTSRGCHQGCTFCAEPLMNGLKFRYRPVDEVMYEVDNCGSRMISINDADFFGTPERPEGGDAGLKGRSIRWQAGVTSKLAQDDAHAGACRRERLYHAVDRLRVDLARDAQERAQARQPPRDRSLR